MKSTTIKNNIKKTTSKKLLINNFSGFTLIEMIVSITIFSMIIVMAFDAMGNIGVIRNKLSSRLDLNNELYNVTEKFINLIKTGGDIDYEEYWNRQTVGTTTASGHYDIFSGFGNYGSGGLGENYGDGLYYCVSGNGTSMGTGGCLVGNQKQRYGQYRQQFIDYNSNANGDGGDENGDGKIQGDDDDEDLGVGPIVLTGGVGMKELYLLKKGITPERTYFRWTLKLDPNAPPGASCETSGVHMGSGECLGNIQLLNLVGKDLGLSHSGAINSDGRYDGIIDTWECREDFYCPGTNIPNALDTGWVDILPTWVNVKNIDFYPYPEKDFRYAWRESNNAIILSSYVRINMTLGLAWERRKKIKGPSGDVFITTTVNLSR
ncbi:MAG: prepilin-type N-terminal cleavage/methylation domain-containing protein [Candidatus Gracilibacteria bacterium]|nr:prepilin-type N-terminal cleavage/methylation domain-containing protein [Candidatus Gracilibacteria bacterium]